MNFKGEVQAEPYFCVFASIVGAVNSVAGKAVWTQQGLFDEWRKQNIDQVNFANIHPVAVQPVKGDVKARHLEDGGTPISNADYLKIINDCVDGGGVAIASFELGQFVESKVVRKNQWHMLSLSRRNGNDFEAWDTAGGKTLTVTTGQLVNYVPYGDRILAVHDRHDLLLVQSV